MLYPKHNIHVPLNLEGFMLDEVSPDLFSASCSLRYSVRRQTGNPSSGILTRRLQYGQFNSPPSLRLSSNNKDASIYREISPICTSIDLVGETGQ